MRILVIAPHPFYIERGTPIDVDILLRALSLRGDRVDVACYAGGEPREYPGVTIHRPATPGWLHDVRPAMSLKKVMSDMLLAVEVLRLLRKNEYDVIHAGEEAGYAAPLLSRAFGVPFVYDLDSSVAQQLVEQLPWLKPLAPVFSRLESAVLRRCLAAAPVCHALGDVARAGGAPYVEILHDISQLEVTDGESRGLLEERWGITAPALLYVGNLQAYQGVDLLLEAFALAVAEGSALDLVVAGGHPDDVAGYRVRAATLGVGDRCHWLGLWPVSRLGELLIEAHILAAPRIKGVNTPQKIFPYLHSGRPVLATALPTHTQILDSRLSELVDATPAAFAEGILRLERDERRREALGRAGRAFVEESHTFPAHRERVDRLYRYVQSRLEETEA